MPSGSILEAGFRDDTRVEGSSFIPGSELRRLVSNIAPFKFSDLDLDQVAGERRSLYSGRKPLYSSKLEERVFTAPNSGLKKTVLVLLRTGKLLDVITRNDALIATTPQGVLQSFTRSGEACGVARSLSTAAAAAAPPPDSDFFTYMLSTCGSGSESRLCFTLAKRAYSFEPGSKHVHMMFLRTFSNIYAAGELGMYGPRGGEPSLIIINRMSGSIMRPLKARNPTVSEADFDAVVALAAGQFLGRDWNATSTTRHSQ